jgi:hypothetical protein
MKAPAGRLPSSCTPPVWRDSVRVRSRGYWCLCPRGGSGSGRPGPMERRPNPLLLETPCCTAMRPRTLHKKKSPSSLAGHWRPPRIDPQHARFLIQTRRSGIHGYGVFAGEPIPAGRKVIEYTGERIARAETLRRALRVMSARGDRRVCLVVINSYWAIDGSVGGSGAEYANHSCEPNLRPRRIRGHLLLFSRRRIRRGEELTWDYHFPAEAASFRCTCGTASCRGTINLRPDRKNRKPSQASRS